ncbi:KRAB [Lepeophtheirus salmonis]|uniref:KRAB n=1 Tax=Lepeophtheirus salmonis TaxID=72036 RepID=A0A7R8H6J6_LEPSM|nr:KRAB [Lepeophtheirus salmonis]CAF2902795.1 KRAB [Lepeophtheirus salmonis]
MSGGKIVVLASKETPGTQSTLGPSQSVLLIQNDVTALREDLIVEAGSREPPCSVKRRILLVEKKILHFIYFPNTITEILSIIRISHRQISLVMNQCLIINAPCTLKPIEKLKDQRVLMNSHFFPSNDFKIQRPKFEDDFESFDNAEIMEKLQSLTEVNVKEENYLNDYEDMDFYSESELLDPLQNHPLELPLSTSLIPNTSPQKSGNLSNPSLLKDFYQKDKSSAATQQPRVPCRFCNGTYKATFLSEHIRKQHLSTSKGYQMIKCDKCEKSFKKCREPSKPHGALTSHLLHLCQELQNFQKIEKHKEDIHKICQVCSSEFLSLAQLTGHIQKEHPRCAICGLIFKNRGVFDKHEKEHYQCLDCDFVFKSIEDKRKHSSMHHACVYCSKVFEKILNLNAHKVAHRTCPICRLQFQTVQEQINHQNTNHFKCHVCSITFRRMEDYTQHQRQAHQINTPKRKPVKETQRIILLESKDN